MMWDCYGSSSCSSSETSFTIIWWYVYPRILLSAETYCLHTNSHLYRSLFWVLWPRNMLWCLKGQPRVCSRLWQTNMPSEWSLLINSCFPDITASYPWFALQLHVGTRSFFAGSISFYFLIFEYRDTIPLWCGSINKDQLYLTDTWETVDINWYIWYPVKPLRHDFTFWVSQSK